ncbi:MAG TPA: putative glycolipid-binding domain-containing protein [Chloroflexia bacterium]|nr:putative glycolipid-binding domain-containing protein [Chloroflexia bacterium]
MQLDILWQGWDYPSLEHLRLAISDREIEADSLFVGQHYRLDEDEDRSPFRFQYNIKCNSQWQILQLDIKLLSPDQTSQVLALKSDGAGSWFDSKGTLLPDLAGCQDVDISITPFTNTLPIRRLSLQPGESADIRVLYIKLPELQYKPVQQRYTCIDQDKHGGLYRFEVPGSDFVVELPVDENKLVLDYPELFRRVVF